MPRYKMVVAYDGTNYAGWQAQPGQPTIQSELERVVKELTGTEQRMHASGRTDRGVHARAQVVHFDLEARAQTGKLMVGFNALLKPDIRVDSLKITSPDFHARHSAREKEYRYFIWNDVMVPPWLVRYRTHIRTSLDVKVMSAAARHLAGTHDFAAFTANPNREIEGTVRQLRRLTVRKRGHEIVMVARADGFLYKMVRSLAGFLIRVGGGELPPDAALKILHSKLRTARVPTAHPQGLFLWRVWY